MATTKRTGERESSFCNRSQSDNLLSAIFRQKQQRKFCDVLIKVCGREIGAHSNVLAAVSPYFAAFFGQDLPRCFSQKCPQLIEIQIDGFTGSDAVYETAVDSVITYAYTGVIWVSDSSVTQVLEIGLYPILSYTIINFYSANYCTKASTYGTLLLPQSPENQVHNQEIKLDNGSDKQSMYGVWARLKMSC